MRRRLAAGCWLLAAMDHTDNIDTVAAKFAEKTSDRGLKNIDIPFGTWQQISAITISDDRQVLRR
jgi:hypothetical protein